MPGAVGLTVHYGCLRLPRLPSYLGYAPGVTGVIAVVMKATFQGVLKLALLLVPRLGLTVGVLELHLGSG